MLPTANEIQYFLEIYGTRHLTNAALRLGITQPTLTQSLQRLESRLGTPLFIRTKQGVVPTAAGKLFESRAKRLAEDWAGLREDLTAAAETVTGRFRLGCHPAVGAYVLPPLLERLNAEAPAIELELSHDFSRRITERLVAFEIDLAFVVNPRRHPDLVLVKIGQDRIGFWKRRGLGKPPRRLLSDANTAEVETLLGKARAGTFEGFSALETPSLELVRTLTREGHGVGILPERFARADGADLVPFDPKLPTFPDEIMLAYRRETLTSRAAKTLLAFARVPLPAL